MLSNLYHRFADIVNVALAITLVVAILLVLCLNCALKTTGYSATLTLGRQEQNTAIDLLASAIDQRQLQPSKATYIRFQPKPRVVKVATR